MSEITTELSQIKTLQQRISVTTWLITLVLSLRGLFVFYGMKEQGSFEQILSFITDPLVQLLSFERIEAIGIPGIGVLFAAITILLVSNVVQLGLKFAEIRITRARKLVFRHAVRSK